MNELSPTITRVSERGNVATELCIILVSFIAFTCGSMDFSLLFTASQAVDNAVREGGRLGAVLQYSSTNPDAWRNSVRARILNKLEMLGYLSDTDITIAEPQDYPSDGLNEQMIDVTVAANYSYRFLGIVGLSSTTIRRSVRMRYEWQVLRVYNNLDPQLDPDYSLPNSLDLDDLEDDRESIETSSFPLTTEELAL